MIPNNEIPYLETNPPRRVQYRVGRRAALAGQIALHTGENDPFISANPRLNLASFIQNRTDGPGSYHADCDHKGSLLLVSYRNEAFHVATHSLNRSTYGLSFANRTTDWVRFTPERLRLTIVSGAERAADMAAWHKLQTGKDIPARLLSLRQVLDGERGFFYHSTADPTRRSDPGRDFPAAMFLNEYDRLIENKQPTKEQLDMVLHEAMNDIREMYFGYRGTAMPEGDQRAWARYIAEEVYSNRKPVQPIVAYIEWILREEYKADGGK